jgi:rhodanese-related sulfurtransferase
MSIFRLMRIGGEDMNWGTKASRALHYFGDKLEFTNGPAEMNTMIKSADKITIVDVRASEDYNKGHIPGAINYPKDRWGMVSLNRDRMTVFYCYNEQCHLAAQAAFTFAKRGYEVMEMEGGWEAWKSSGFEIQKIKPMMAALHITQAA